MPSAAAAQEFVLSGDRYTLEVRRLGDGDWRPTAGYAAPLIAADAARIVNELNSLSQCCVYRAVLVEVSHG